MISLNILLLMFGITIVIAHFTDILIDEDAAKNLLTATAGTQHNHPLHQHQKQHVMPLPPEQSNLLDSSSDGGGDNANNGNGGNDENQSAPCQVEYQVMQRTIGHCVKLGRVGYGCVSGNYLHPFHPDCAK